MRTTTPPTDASPRLRAVTLRDLAMVALAAVALVLAWNLRQLLLLVFASVLVAALLGGIATFIRRHTAIGPRASLALAVVSVAAVLVGLFWIAGAQLYSQMSELVVRLPQAWARATEWAAGATNGAAMGWLQDFAPSGGRVMSQIGTAASFVLGATTSVLLVAVGGIYFAAQPHVYRRGLLRLVPPERREQYGRAYDRLAQSVQRWLLMQLGAMVIVGLVTGLLMWALGVPTPLALGVLAGLLEFVPVAGPILAAIPALLVALSVSPELVLWVALAYLAIQQLEGNVLMPMLAERVIAIPPAVMLFALLGFATLFGLAGVLLAAPLMVIVYVAVREFYVEHALEGRPIEAERESA